MVISLFIMVAGALLFIPAASCAKFPLFLTASFVLAAGVCALQTAANPYVSILGPEHSAPARLNLAQAFNSLGTALAPIVVRHFYPHRISAKAQSEATVAHTVQGPIRHCRCAPRARLHRDVPPPAGDHFIERVRARKQRLWPQHLELQAHGAGHGRHLLLCGPGGFTVRQRHQVL